AENRDDWRRMGVGDPQPFDRPQFFAPQAKGLATPVPTGGRTGPGGKPYNRALADIIEHGGFCFLFSHDDGFHPNFRGLGGDVEECLTFGTAAGPRLGAGRPQTFQDLLDDFKKDKGASLFPDAHSGTRAKFFRRLKYVVNEGEGVLRKTDAKANPLVIP